jgi:hypothetical protein
MWAGVDASQRRGKRARIANTPNTAPTGRRTGITVRHTDVSPNHQHFPVLYYYY